MSSTIRSKLLAVHSKISLLALVFSSIFGTAWSEAASAARIHKIEVLHSNPSCESFFILGGNSRRVRSAILIQTSKDLSILGVADRVTEHMDILIQFIQLKEFFGEPLQISWSGELLLSNSDPQQKVGQLLEANNTSGTAFAMMSVLYASSDQEAKQIKSALNPQALRVFEEMLSSLEIVKLDNAELRNFLRQNLVWTLTPTSQFFDFGEKPHLGDIFPESGSPEFGLRALGNRTHDLSNALFGLGGMAAALESESGVPYYPEQDFENRQYGSPEAKLKLFLENLEKVRWLTALYVSRGRNDESFVQFLELVPELIQIRGIDAVGDRSLQEVARIISAATLALQKALEHDRGQVEFYIAEPSLRAR